MAGHLKRSATTGHLLHGPTGHLVRDCNQCVLAIEGTTPATISANINGMGYTGGTPACLVPGCDDLNASVYELTQCANDPCLWAITDDICSETDKMTGIWAHVFEVVGGPDDGDLYLEMFISFNIPTGETPCTDPGSSSADFGVKLADGPGPWDIISLIQTKTVPWLANSGTNHMCLGSASSNIVATAS